MWHFPTGWLGELRVPTFGEGGSSRRLWRRTRSEGLERMEEEADRSCNVGGLGRPSGVPSAGRRLHPSGCVPSQGPRDWLCNGDLLAGRGWAGLGLEALSALALRGSSFFLFVTVHLKPLPLRPSSPQLPTSAPLSPRPTW